MPGRDLPLNQTHQVVVGTVTPCEHVGGGAAAAG